MATKEDLLTALAPLITFIEKLDASDPTALQKLNAEFPVSGPVVAKVRALVREGVEARWLCDRENSGVRYSRVRKSDGANLSIDAVHMSGPGAAHTHPGGEFDLCFAVSGSPKFDTSAEGWTVYAPNSWHVPTVTGGVMDILYFLPRGAMQFGDKPASAVAVGLQAA